jgi:hypothetical protein
MNHVAQLLGGVLLVVYTSQYTQLRASHAVCRPVEETCVWLVAVCCSPDARHSQASYPTACIAVCVVELRQLRVCKKSSSPECKIENSVSMKSFIFIACALALLCGSNALPSIVSSQDCGNGISCASSQTCMSNATGAGLLVIISALCAITSVFLTCPAVCLLPSSQRRPLQ